MDPTIQFLFSAVFVLIGSLAFHISALVSGENIYRELSTQESTLLSIVVGIVIFLLSPISFIILQPSTNSADILVQILDPDVLLAFFGCAFGLGLIFGCVTILQARVRILNWFRDKSGMCFWISSYAITWTAFLDGVKRKGEISIQTDNEMFKGLLVAFSIRDGQREIVLGKSKIEKDGIETDIAGEENEEVLIPGSEIKRIIVPERSFKKHYEPMVHISQAFYCIILAIGFFFLSYSAKLTGNYIPNLEIASLESFFGRLSPIFLALTIIILGVSVWVAQKDFDNWRSFLVLSPPITFVAFLSSLLAILLILFNMKISQALILIFALAFISPPYIKIIDWLDKHEGSIKKDCRKGIKKYCANWKSFLSLPHSKIFKEDFEKPPKTLESPPKVYRGWNGKRSKSKYSKDFSLLLFILLLCIFFVKQILPVLISMMDPYFSRLSGWLDIDSFKMSWVLIFIFVFSLLCITISNWLKKPIKDCFDEIKKDFEDNTKLLEVIQQFYLHLSCNDKSKAHISDIAAEIYENDEHVRKWLASDDENERRRLEENYENVRKVSRLIAEIKGLKDCREYLENEDFNIISRFKYFIKKEKG